MGKYKKKDKLYAGYEKRNVRRRKRSTKAVIDLVVHFIKQGNSQAEANDMVDQVSYTILKNCPHGIIGLEKGNSRCKADLIAEIRGLDEVELPFMDQVAKDIFINDLT